MNNTKVIKTSKTIDYININNIEYNFKKTFIDFDLSEINK